MADLSYMLNGATSKPIPGGTGFGSAGGGDAGGGRSIVGSVLHAASKPLGAALWALDLPRAAVSAGANEFDRLIHDPTTAFSGKSLKQDLGLLKDHKSILDVLNANTVERGGTPWLSGSGLGSVLTHAALGLGLDLAADPMTYLGVGLVDDVGKVRKLGTGIEAATALGDSASGAFKASLARRGFVATAKAFPEEFSKLGRLTLTMGDLAIPGTENIAKALLAPTKLKQPILEALTIDSSFSKTDRLMLDGIMKSPVDGEKKIQLAEKLLGPTADAQKQAARRNMLNLLIQDGPSEKISNLVVTLSRPDAENVVRQIGIGGKRPRIQEAARATLKAIEDGTPEDVVLAGAKFDATLAATHAKSMVRSTSQLLTRHVDENLQEVGIGVARDFGKDLPDGGAKQLTKALKDVRDYERQVGLMSVSADEVMHAEGDAQAVRRAFDAGTATADQVAAAESRVAGLRAQMKSSGVGWSRADFEDAIRATNREPNRAHEIMFAVADGFRKAMRDTGITDPAIIDSLLHGDITVAAMTDAHGLQLVAQGGEAMQAGGLFAHLKRHINGFGTAEKAASKYGSIARKADRILTGRYSIVGEAVRASFEDTARDLVGRTMSSSGKPLEEAFRKAGLYQDFSHLTTIGNDLRSTKGALEDSLKLQANAVAQMQEAEKALDITNQALLDAIAARDAAAAAAPEASRIAAQAVEQAPARAASGAAMSEDDMIKFLLDRKNELKKQVFELQAQVDKAVKGKKAVKGLREELLKATSAHNDAKTVFHDVALGRASEARLAEIRQQAQEFAFFNDPAARIKETVVPTDLPSAIDPIANETAHATLLAETEDLHTKLRQALHADFEAQGRFNKWQRLAEEETAKTDAFREAFDNAKHSAEMAVADLPAKLRANHGQIVAALYDNVLTDQFWTERALGLVATEFTNHGVAGWLDRETSQYVSSLLFSEDNIGKVVKKITGITNYMRSAMLLSPAFHSRNMIGAAINNAFYGVRLKDYRAFARMFYAEPSEWTDSFKSLVELLPSADRRQLLHQSAMGLNPTEYDRPSARLIQHLSDKLEDYSPVKNALAGRFTGGKESLQVETMARGALFMKLVDQRGMSPEAAWFLVGKVHVDYTDVSKLDVAMRRVIPFYMYMSRNLPLQLEWMARGGSLSSRIEEHRRNTTDAGLPPFAAGSYLNLGAGYSFNLGGLNPATDLFGSRAGDSGAQAPLGVLSQLRDGINPLIGNLWYLADGQKRGKGYGLDAYAADMLPTYRSFQALVPNLTPQSLPQVLRPASPKDRTSTPVNIASAILGGSPIRTFTR